MAYTRASQAVAARIRERGRFNPKELLKVSLDRPRRNYAVWMGHSEVELYAPTAMLRDRVYHVSGFPEIAALERLLVAVCPACLDELLVRSGEQPTTPISREQAFDDSVVAAGAELGENVIKCDVHGLVFPTRSSSKIANAIDKRGAIQKDRLIKVVVPSARHESEFWFDVDFIAEMLGRDLSNAPPPIRLEDRATVDRLLFAGVRVCRRCLDDFLGRNAGIDKVHDAGGEQDD